jgi:hypothetical protein
MMPMGRGLASAGRPPTGNFRNISLFERISLQSAYLKNQRLA